jgi:hypothetical protein
MFNPPKASADPLLRVLLSRAMRFHSATPPKPPKIGFTGPKVNAMKEPSFGKVNRKISDPESSGFSTGEAGGE